VVRFIEEGWEPFGGRVERIEGKGHGVVATKKISPGEVVLKEVGARSNFTISPYSLIVLHISVPRKYKQ